MAMNIVVCPGCGEDAPHENSGCAHCGYENNNDGRLLTMGELLAKPSYPQPGALRLNDVCSAFLRRIVAEARKTPNAKVSGPEAALSPEGRARLTGSAALDGEGNDDE